MDYQSFSIGPLLVRTAPLGPISTNAYIIGCQETGQGAIIDACAEGERLIHMIEHKPALNVVYLLQTHAHIDHVMALQAMKDHTGAPIFIHKDEMPVYDSVPMQGMMFFGKQLPALPKPDVMVEEGSKIQVGNLEAEVLLTPGHTPGSICYYFKAQNAIFSGDVLFAGSIGRTDLPGGDMNAMRKSLERLKTLPDETRIFSGHGPDTTLGEEKKRNPFLQPGF